MAILWRFLRCQVPPSGARIVRMVLQRVLGRYLRHGAFAARERYGRISPRNGREVHVSGNYDNLSFLSHILFSRELRRTMTLCDVM